MLRMLRSAVFMVPMNSRLLGQSKSGGVLQVDRVVAILEQVHQLAEDSREIGPVHLVDDEDKWPIVGVHCLDYGLHDPWSNFEDWGSALGPRTKPLHELFVTVARMELNEAPATRVVFRQIARDCSCHLRFAGSRGTREHNLVTGTA